MKDSEFIALLNLYLDHEISAADAARLEAEVQNNPARRKIYRQYCQMQKGCKVLASDFVSPAEAAATPAERKVIAFNVAAAEVAATRRKRAGNFYVAGTFAAAAACVAIIFVGRNRQQEAEQSALLAQQEMKAPAVAGGAQIAPVNAIPTAAAKATHVAAASPVSSGPRILGGVNQNTTLVPGPLQLDRNVQAEALMVAAQEQAKAQFAWLESTQLAPVQVPLPLTELRFETAPATLRPEGRVLGNRATNANANVEMTAIQFVK